MASCLIFLPHYAFLLLPHYALLLPFYLIFLPHYAFLLHHASLNTNSVSFNTCATPTPTLLVNYLRLLLHCISHFLLHYISFTTPRVFDYTIPHLLHHAFLTTPYLVYYTTPLLLHHASLPANAARPLPASVPGGGPYNWISGISPSMDHSISVKCSSWRCT